MAKFFATGSNASTRPEAPTSFAKISVDCPQLAPISYTHIPGRTSPNHLGSGRNLQIDTYKLLITEVTNFGELRCVAGWDLDRQKMIRPEPYPTGFWQADKIAPAGKFEVGKTASFIGTKPNPATGYPHMTEDRVVTSEIAVGPVVDAARKQKVLREAAFDSLDEIFDGKLLVDGLKAYVPVGTQCRSLGGLIVPAKGAVIESYQNYGGKERLRLRFRDAKTYLGAKFDLHQGLCGARGGQA